MTRNIRLLIAYDGSRYHGWQRQKDVATIQGAIEQQLASLIQETVTLHGAGRTDAGVHATGMVANFHSRTSLPVSTLQRGLNALLSGDIRILQVKDMPGSFHSRFSASGKQYRYDLCTADVLMPTRRLYMAHIPCRLDRQRLVSGMRAILGTHDFSSFEASGSRDRDNPGGRGAVRTIFHAWLQEWSEQPDCWSLYFVGDGFLRHMVRNLVGTLLQLARGRTDLDGFIDVIRVRDRRQAGPTAPACGLFLEKVFYSQPVPHQHSS